MRDAWGPVVGTVETAQTFLTAVEVDALVGDYLAGMSGKSLVERYSHSPGHGGLSSSSA